ncbi:MAG: PASTA domain-containing protein [Clostridia bacterium]|nr:PASTA domain-containing protein [Clostridia bacterium]
MRKKNHISKVLLIALVLLLLCGCERIEVPDVIDNTEKTAVKKIEKAGLIPIVEYEYRDRDEKDKVFMTSPRILTTVKKNSEVVVYISKGPEKIVAKNAYCKWTSMGKTEDKWEFILPYVEKGILYIDCHNVVLKDSIEWQKSDEEGVTIAQVSLTEDFEVSVPAKLRYEKKSTAPFEAQRFVLEIELAELGEENPEELNFKLPALKNGVSEDIRLDFSVTW